MKNNIKINSILFGILFTSFTMVAQIERIFNLTEPVAYFDLTKFVKNSKTPAFNNKFWIIENNISKSNLPIVTNDDLDKDALGTYFDSSPTMFRPNNGRKYFFDVDRYVSNENTRGLPNVLAKDDENFEGLTLSVIAKINPNNLHTKTVFFTATNVFPFLGNFAGNDKSHETLMLWSNGSKIYLTIKTDDEKKYDYPFYAPAAFDASPSVIKNNEDKLYHIILSIGYNNTKAATESRNQNRAVKWEKNAVRFVKLYIGKFDKKANYSTKNDVELIDKGFIKNTSFGADYAYLPVLSSKQDYYWYLGPYRPGQVDKKDGIDYTLKFPEGLSKLMVWKKTFTDAQAYTLYQCIKKEYDSAAKNFTPSCNCWDSPINANKNAFNNPEIKEDNRVRYNPTIDNLVIEELITIETGFKIIKISVFDLTGKLLGSKSVRISSESNVIQINNMKSQFNITTRGVYIVHLNDGQIASYKKILIE